MFLELFMTVIFRSKKSVYLLLSLGLTDSGNLLPYPIISQRLHQLLGGHLRPTVIQGHRANDIPLSILGICQGVKIRIAGTDQCLTFTPLVVKELASQINIMAQFGYAYGMQIFLGNPTNFALIVGWGIPLFCQNVTST